MKRRLDENLMSAVGSAGRLAASIPIVSMLFDSMADDEDEEGKDALKQDVAELSRESMPLGKALEIDKEKKALIIGSSQAGVMGHPVMRSLEDAGFTGFNFGSATAKSMRYVHSHILSGLPNREQYDVIVIFPGFRVGESPDDVIDIISLFEPSRCFVVIPPPVTEIEDTESAAKLGLNKGRVMSDYWFLLRGGKYAEEREEYCKDLKSAVKESGATAIDPREVVAGAINESVQPTGTSFPNSPDGIHPGPEVAEQIADAVSAAILSSDKLVSTAGVLKTIKPDDIEKSPNIIASLAPYPAAAAIVSTAKGRITSNVGHRTVMGKKGYHQGLDIGIPVGNPVRASLEGEVIRVVSDSPKAGKYIELQHQNGDVTRYLHLSKSNVREGDMVGTGQVIGLTGGARGAPGSGRSTGPHLHWETWEGGGFKKGKLTHPLDWLKKNTGSIKPVDF